MGTTAPPHELFEDGPRAGAVYKAGFAALTAPDVMAGAAGGPVARELPPFRPAPHMGSGGGEKAVSQIPLRSIQVRQGLASRSPQDCVYNSYEEPEFSDKDSGGSRGSSAGLHMISYQRTLLECLVWPRMVFFATPDPTVDRLSSQGEGLMLATSYPSGQNISSARCRLSVGRWNDFSYEGHFIRGFQWMSLHYTHRHALHGPRWWWAPSAYLESTHAHFYPGRLRLLDHYTPV